MRLLGVAPIVPGVDQMAVLHNHFNNNSHCTIKLSYLEILLVEGEVVEPVGEGVDVGDEFRARRVHVGVEEDLRIKGVLLPQEGVEELHHGGEEVAPQAQLLYGVDLHFTGQFPVLKRGLDLIGVKLARLQGKVHTEL